MDDTYTSPKYERRWEYVKRIQADNPTTVRLIAEDYYADINELFALRKTVALLEERIRSLEKD